MKHISKLTLFWIALAICIVGGTFIYVGDGGERLFNKGIVISGLVLTVGGIGILRYLLFAKKS